MVQQVTAIGSFVSVYCIGEGQTLIMLDFCFHLKEYLQSAAVNEQGTMKSGSIHKQGQAAIQNGSIKCSNRTHVGLKSQALPLNKHSGAFTVPASLLSGPFAKQGELVMSWLVVWIVLFMCCVCADVYACLKVHIPTHTCAHTSLPTVPKMPSD